MQNPFEDDLKTIYSSIIDILADGIKDPLAICVHIAKASPGVFTDAYYATHRQYMELVEDNASCVGESSKPTAYSVKSSMENQGEKPKSDKLKVSAACNASWYAEVLHTLKTSGVEAAVAGLRDSTGNTVDEAMLRAIVRTISTIHGVGIPGNLIN